MHSHRGHITDGPALESRTDIGDVFLHSVIEADLAISKCATKQYISHRFRRRLIGEGRLAIPPVSIVLKQYIAVFCDHNQGGHGRMIHHPRDVWDFVKIIVPGLIVQRKHILRVHHQEIGHDAVQVDQPFCTKLPLPSVDVRYLCMSVYHHNLPFLLFADLRTIGG
jgi:hypothetical protein